jgi:rhamnulokinase
VASATGLQGARVVLPGTHDTASAVMAVPAQSQSGAMPQWCYISSGTWSLMGVETPEPVINDACRERNFTNEGGVENTIRLLKNIAGLWIVQECRRNWQEQGREFDWDQLVGLASQCPPLVSLIDPDDRRFVAPSSMVEAIGQFCAESRQPVPDQPGAVIRCVLESLALRYRSVLQWLEELLGGRLATIHIVGGGTQNRLLCQMAADACNRPVVAGPVEATAIGNLMMQAVAAGSVAGVAQAREVIRHSFATLRYEPQHHDRWDQAFARFTALGSG